MIKIAMTATKNTDVKLLENFIRKAAGTQGKFCSQHPKDIRSSPLGLDRQTEIRI
jgi:hypothetical protein